jgi:hypothetical protein
MSFINESFNIGKKNMVVGNGKEDFDITCINGYEVKINGIVPGAGGGGGVPPVGDIDFIGNLNCNDQPGGGSKGIITAEKQMVAGLGGIQTSGNIEITSNGNLTLNGNGSILQLGSGKISTGSDGIESYGNIKTIGAFDLEIGKDIYFDGTDIYHRTNNPVAQESYKDFKQLAGLNDANKFTGANQFNSNTTEFAAKVSVGTRDPNTLLFTQNLALNTSGNIESKTINNNTTIQTGTINCGNGGENEIRARQFNTRTNEHNLPDGWVIEQGLPNSPAQPVDKILQIRAQEAGAVVSITPSDFSGTNPAIILDPNTTANGGKIYAANFTLGSTVDRYRLTQDITGALSDTLQISAPTANSKVEFRDNSNNVILDVKKTEVVLGNTIPINFGNYSFRPQQYSRNITLTIDGTKDTTNFTNMIFNPRTNTDWTNVNTGSTNQTLYNAALAGYYKCTVTQTALSNLGNYEAIKVIFDYILEFSTQTSPDIEPPLTYGYKKKPSGGQQPVIDVDHTNNPVQSQPVFLLFPNQNAGETMLMTVKLTKLDF